MSRRRIVRLEEFLGRRVLTADGKSVGRIEEVRVQRQGSDHEVTELLLGTGALLERWSIVRHMLRRAGRTLVARWDQIDLSRPRTPRLTCDPGQLKEERASAP